MQEKRRKSTIAKFEVFHGSKELGAFVRVIYPRYFWWMSHEFTKAKTPQDLALIHATSRARTFWAICGVVCAAPVVLVIMFLLHQPN